MKVTTAIRQGLKKVDGWVESVVLPIVEDPKKWWGKIYPTISKWFQEKSLPWITGAIAATVCQQYHQSGENLTMLILAGLVGSLFWKPAIAAAAAGTMGALLEGSAATNQQHIAIAWMAWIIWKAARKEFTSLDSSPAGIILAMWALWIATTNGYNLNFVSGMGLAIGLMSGGKEARLAIALTCLFITHPMIQAQDPNRQSDHIFTTYGAGIAGLISTPGILGKLLAIQPTLDIIPHKSTTITVMCFAVWAALPFAWLIQRFEKKCGKPKTWVVVCMLAVAGLAAAPTIYPKITETVGKTTNLSNRSSIIWPTTANIIRTSPWDGLGDSHTNRLDEMCYLYGGNRVTNHAHNMLLEYWARWGAGAAVFLLMLIPACVFHKGNDTKTALTYAPIWMMGVTGHALLQGGWSVWAIPAMGQTGVKDAPAQKSLKWAGIICGTIALVWMGVTWTLLPKTATEHRELWLVQSTNPEESTFTSAMNGTAIIREHAKKLGMDLTIDTSSNTFAIIAKSPDPEIINRFAEEVSSTLKIGILRTFSKIEIKSLERRNILIAGAPMMLCLIFLLRGSNRSIGAVVIFGVALLIANPLTTSESDGLSIDYKGKKASEWNLPTEWPLKSHQELSIRLHAFVVATMLDRPGAQTGYRISKDGTTIEITAPFKISTEEKETVTRKAATMMESWKHFKRTEEN